MYKHSLFHKVLLPSLLFFPLLCASCDYAIVASGTVYDKRTKLPVAGATVWEKGAVTDSTVTDSTGHFSLTSQRAGAYSRHVKIVVQKKDYKPQKVTVSTKYHEEINLVPKND